MPGPRGGLMGPLGAHGPNVATELEAAGRRPTYRGGLGVRSPPSYPPMGPQGPRPRVPDACGNR